MQGTRKVAGVMAAPVLMVGVAAGLALATAAGHASAAPTSAPADVPTISTVRCVSRCTGVRGVRTGSLVHVTGRDLAGVRRIVFRGGRGYLDNAVTSAIVLSDAAVDVVVPAGAGSGKLIAVAADGSRSLPSVHRIRRTGAQIRTTSPLRIVVAGRRLAPVEVPKATPGKLMVQVLRAGTHHVVRRWSFRTGPGTHSHSVSWDGRIGGAAPLGRYEIRVVPVSGMLAGTMSEPLARQAFALYGSGGPTDADIFRTAPGAAATIGADGLATAPQDAPAVVQAIIAAGNQIATTPYVFGGGHGSWDSIGYDCSGSVSYALHGGGLLDSTLTSGALEGWGEPGVGRWVTVYANPAHAYMVVAGLRFDTSGAEGGTRWQPDTLWGGGYVARHPLGL